MDQAGAVELEQMALLHMREAHTVLLNAMTELDVARVRAEAAMDNLHEWLARCEDAQRLRAQCKHVCSEET